MVELLLLAAVDQKTGLWQPERPLRYSIHHRRMRHWRML
jgi:hypothetical protein